nr:MAG TPA: Putative minor capsid protein [Microviridae sp.]
MRFLDIGESMLSPKNEHHFIGAIFNSLATMSSTKKTNDMNYKIAKETAQYNAKQARLQREWQEKMVDESRAYNTPQAMIARGLNPFLQGSAAITGAGSGSAPSGAVASTHPVSMQAVRPDFSSIDSAIASFAQAKKAISEGNQIETLTPYMVKKLQGDTNYRNIGIGDSGYWNKETGRISAELDQSMERQALENAVTASKLSAAQTTQIYLQADAQSILNKYMDANQQADLFTKCQYLYNLVQQGVLTEKQIQTELARAVEVSARARGQEIYNKIAEGTADSLITATNMAYYTQYYDSLWDYKNVNHRKNMQFSKDKALRDYYKWSAGNAKKDFDSYGLRNAVDYGTKLFQSMPKSIPFFRSSRGEVSSSNGVGL